MGKQELKWAILEELRRRPAGLFELSVELDESPRVILEALDELKAEEKVNEVPFQTVYWRVE